MYVIKIYKSVVMPGSWGMDQVAALMAQDESRDKSRESPSEEWKSQAAPGHETHGQQHGLQDLPTPHTLCCKL